ncbi:MAG: YceD family protein [Gemmatimonadales bacterium]
MLRVDIRELAQGPVETRGELAPDDPLLTALDIQLAAPVAIDGRLQAIGEGRFYWHGRLHSAVRGECRRCLAPVAAPVTAEIGALFTRDADVLEDPDAYPVPPEATEVDLAPAVREELLLAVPRYALCREDCQGLCPQCGKDRNADPCDCPPVVDARWQPLQSLKDKLRS